MKLIRFVVAACLLLPAAYGQKKDQMMEMQRDIALLQDTIRTLQASLNDKLAELKALSQQTADAAQKTNAGFAALEAGIRDRMAEQQKTVSAPMANLSSKVDQMATEFQGVRETVADMNARLSKLQTQVVDLGNQMKVMSAPPPAPTPTGGDSGSSGPPPGMTATGLYENAARDQLSGKQDLALQEFSDYLRYYSSTSLAPNAQFQIAEILYAKGDYESAFKAFDTVLEKWGESNKALDAQYMKGMSLEQMKQPTKAAQEYRALIKAAPTSAQATKAKARLKALGLPYTTAAPAKSAKKRR